MMERFILSISVCYAAARCEAINLTLENNDE
jgi:hypothetical protein